MAVKVRFRKPQVDLIFLLPTVLIHKRNKDAPINFIFGISVDWLYWQMAIAFEKQQ